MHLCALQDGLGLFCEAGAINVSGTTGLMRLWCARMLPLHRIAHVWPGTADAVAGLPFCDGVASALPRSGWRHARRRDVGRPSFGALHIESKSVV